MSAEGSREVVSPSPVMRPPGRDLDVGALTEALDALWEVPDIGRRQDYLTEVPEPLQGMMSSRDLRPIRGSVWDQEVPRGRENPLWEIARRLPAQAYPSFGVFGGGRLEVADYGLGLLGTELYPYAGQAVTGEGMRLFAAGANQHSLSMCFSFSLVTPGDVRWMTEVLDGRGVVEVGAGTGYWAWQLAQAGVKVAAGDRDPIGVRENQWCEGGPYAPVVCAGPELAGEYPERALLLVWPPPLDPFAVTALRAYQGDLLLCAGTEELIGDGEFWRELESGWELADTCGSHVTWWGLHDQLCVYRRSGPGGRG